MNRDSVIAVQDKSKTWKRYQFCKSKRNFDLYAEKRNTCLSRKACRSARMNFGRLIAGNIKTDS